MDQGKGEFFFEYPWLDVCPGARDLLWNAPPLRRVAALGWDAPVSGALHFPFCSGELPLFSWYVIEYSRAWGVAFAWLIQDDGQWSLGEWPLSSLQAFCDDYSLSITADTTIPEGTKLGDAYRLHAKKVREIVGPETWLERMEHRTDP